MNHSQSPHTIEPMIIGALEAEKQQIFNYLNSCPLGAPAPVMAQWIAGLDPFVWSFQQRTPVVNWLTRQGLPQAEQLLQTLIRDLATARQQYLAMYQDMLQTEVNCAAIWQEALNFATYNSLAATRYSTAVFQRWQEGYFDITEERCFACHLPIGIVGGGYHFECARRLGLI